MLALVEHHALSSLPHGGISDLCSSRQSFFCQRLQDLGGPNDRDMRSFAETCGLAAAVIIVPEDAPEPLQTQAKV